MDDSKKLISMSVQITSNNNDSVRESAVKYLQSFMASQGFPSKSLVGEGGSRAAWVIVQHSNEIKFMKKYLLAMKENSQDIDKELIAFLADKISILESRPQIYGTQVSKTDKGWQPKPIANPEEVNKRRKELGMNSLQAYIRYLESI